MRTRRRNSPPPISVHCQTPRAVAGRATNRRGVAAPSISSGRPLRGCAGRDGSPVPTRLGPRVGRSAIALIWRQDRVLYPAAPQRKTSGWRRPRGGGVWREYVLIEKRSGGQEKARNDPDATFRAPWAMGRQRKQESGM